MDAERLKALQAPLKERYRTEPATALVTLRARGHATEGISCRVETEGDLDFRGTLGFAALLFAVGLYYLLRPIPPKR